MWWNLRGLVESLTMDFLCVSISLSLLKYMKAEIERMKFRAEFNGRLGEENNPEYKMQT